MHGGAVCGNPPGVNTKLKGAVVMNRILFFCGLLACVGCGPSGPAQSVENYFPCAVGSSWTYTWGDTTASFTNTIAEVFTNAHNVQVYRWELGTEDATYSAYIDGQVVFLDAPDDTLGEVVLKEPFEVGATWCSDPLDTSTVCRIDETKASVSTHAGEFVNCIKVSTRWDVEEVLAFYFAPGVGLVKRTAPDEEDMSLYEYDLK
jgi:hypothetical protein